MTSRFIRLSPRYKLAALIFATKNCIERAAL